VGEFRRRSDVPKLSIVNSVSVEPVDEEAIRVYGKVLLNVYNFALFIPCMPIG
jgi:hypothetical protein